MLLPEEFSVRYIGNLTGVALLLPRNKYEEAILFSDLGKERMAVFLSSDDFSTFLSFQVPLDSTTWKGLMVPKFEIEVDEASMFDPQAEHLPLGALVRLQDKICIISNVQGGQPGNRYKIPLVVDLDECDEGLGVGFRSWSICVGEGELRRCLKKIDVK